jgi:hypothetical protein
MSIAIGILDNYTQVDYDNCYNSIPEPLRDSIFTVSSTNNKLKGKNFKFNRETSYAAMRNYALTQFRADPELKYYFLINSNLAITDVNIFNHTINLASNFGTWFMTGPCGNVLEVEDEEHKLTLQVSPELNTNFLFIHFGVIKNCGYFNEQFYETDILDVLDYIIRMRDNGLYLPHFYNPIVNFGLYKSESKVQKIPARNLEKGISLSFGLFQHQHGYIPGHSDPKPASKEDMFTALEKLQKKYARRAQ